MGGNGCGLKIRRGSALSRHPVYVLYMRVSSVCTVHACFQRMYSPCSFVYSVHGKFMESTFVYFVYVTHQYIHTYMLCLSLSITSSLSLSSKQ